MTKKLMIMFIRQKDEYRAKAPCIPKLDTNEGTALTEINREILSRTPRRPQPRLLMSLGSSSPNEQQR